MKKFLISLLLVCICPALAAQKIDTTFCDASLSEVLRHLNRSQSRYVINFMYDELEEFRVTATVRNKSVPDALEQLIGFYPVRVKTVGKNEIYVESLHKTIPLYTGSITDENRLPLGFANVALLSPTDSTLLAGGVTNNDGRVAIPCEREKVIARISHIGYRTLYLTCENFQMGTIQMEPDTLSIYPVVVDGHSPLLRIERGKLVFDTRHIAGAVHAADLLRYAPGVILNDNRISVLGDEGIIFCINGKEQRLSAAETLQMLKSFPASEVERIEIERRPDARFLSSGNSGVINLVLNKKDNDYMGGSIGYAHTQYAEHGDEATANVVFNRGNVSSLLNVAGTWDNTRYSENGIVFFPRVTQTNADKGHIGNHHYTARWQMDYNASEQLALGAYALYANGRRNLDEKGEHSYEQNNIYGLKDAICNSQRGEKTHTFSLNTNASQKLRLKNGKIDYNLDFYRMSMNDHLRSTETGSLPGSQSNISNYQNVIDQTVNNYSAKTDATIGGMKAGAQYAYTRTARKLTDTWEKDYTEWSDFVYDEQILSAYAEYGGGLGKRLSYRIGGRYEQTWTNGRTQTNSLEENGHSAYGRFFPILNVNYTPNKRNSFRWNLSGHIERPNILNINPDSLHYDAYNYSAGNPELKPSYLYKAAMGYNYKGCLDLDIFYAYQPDRMTRIRHAGWPFVFTTWDNAVDEQSLGINSFYTFSHLPWMNAVLMQGVSWNRFRNSKERTHPIVQGWSYTASLQTSFFLDRKRNWTANLNVNYSSREKDLFQTLDACYRADVGLQYRCFRDRLVLNLACRNLLASRTKGWEDIGQTQMYFNNRHHYRQVLLSLTYNWGAKLRQNRRSYNSDEVQKRVVNDF